jgi:hypothetical protein
MTLRIMAQRVKLCESGSESQEREQLLRLLPETRDAREIKQEMLDKTKSLTLAVSLMSPFGRVFCSRYRI